MKGVIYNEEEGIYLGECMGLGFWSKMDPCGQEAACLFESEEEMRKYIESWNESEFKHNEFKFVPVEAKGDYATIEECVAAGLPAWDPDPTLTHMIMQKEK